MTIWDPFLYAEGADLDANGDRLVSYSEYGAEAGKNNIGFGIPFTYDFDVIEDALRANNGIAALEAMAEQWLDQAGLTLALDARSLTNILITSQQGNSLLTGINSNRINAEYIEDHEFEIGGLLLTAAGAAYYNNANSIAYLVDQIAEYWQITGGN